MKFLQVILLTLTLLLVVPLLVESSSSSSSSDNSLVSNITRGSSLSFNDTSPYWLSPSGNLAFGFYPLQWYPGRYVVGIWFFKSSKQTLVWTANVNEFPLHTPSSILFTDQGKLVLRTENKDLLLLPNVPEPASYAKMQDDGNFVLYGSDSQIVWQSFDYPTDTILGGQKLRPQIDLISGIYRLSVSRTDGFVAIYRKTIVDQDGDSEGDITEESVSVISAGDSLSRPVTLSLDIDGKLYLANSDAEVVKVFYQDKRKQQVKDDGDYIYRATLSSIGRLNLYKERINGGGNNNTQDNPHQKSSATMVWSSSPKTDITTGDDVRPNHHASDTVLMVMLILFCIGLGVFAMYRYCTSKVNKDESGGCLELGTRT
ncbi:G-type lectin S-receptor-like serine/threonine-protein kinase LECRK1 [Papaver somniferum]|uniref:G-type lectin S-receptor-like serine/threonine-protein kinase LECRK1 n=1 Tax=Papaver somniferum TaxID=3469 RepID=UPI000E6FDD42|nr:G-type lectin S-receptor-like serine/threonine-protein kinase LECRK1 [Papaver somniferum]